jgi:uncharacterized membrane protein YccC
VLVALALAFALGGLLFPTHWFWVVLTAFIVCSGTVARGDAIYKGLLRFVGALSGTLVAAVVSLLPDVAPPVRAAAIFLVLFFALWLRERNYAYWAAGATLIFALLQGSGATEPWMLFSLRVLGIVLGALCAIAATWFVMPIRTEQIVRKRVADLLAAQKHGDAVDHHLEALERAAAPLRLHRWIFRRIDDEEHPAALAERVARHVRSQKK